jgi:PAS domain S-box-containing protein
MSVSLEEFDRRQQALADFGEFTLRCDDLQQVLQEGCRLVADALQADLAKVLEISDDRQTALVRAGVGWAPGVVGQKRLSLDDKSSETFAIASGTPMVTPDIATETRFVFADFMLEHGVVALVNVPIFLPGGEAYGVLEVDATKARDFPHGDVQFLRTYACTLGPVIDRLNQINKLARSNERFRLVVENAKDFAILISDPDDIVTDWFPGAEAIFGWSEHEMIGRSASTIFTPEDNESGATAGEIAMAAAQGKAPDVRWHVTKAGRRVYMDGQTIALRTPDGMLQGFLKIAQNLTDRKRMEERQVVLLAELQHRVRNVLAMVAAVVRRSSLNVSTGEFRDHLSGRIAAMARTQVLLTRGAGMGVDMSDMIRDELLIQAADRDQIVLSGPALTLAPKAAEVLTLAIHELATNASKYGALVTKNGYVTVQWDIDRRAEQDWLILCWAETGVAFEDNVSRGRGFGTELVTRRVPYELRGSGEMKFEPDGLRCRISFPLVPGESFLQEGVSPTALRDEGQS